MAKSSVRKTLPRKEWVRLFESVDTRYPTGIRDKAMYYFAYYTGIRVGELVNLRMDDVDTAKGVFITPMEGKTGQRRLGIPDSKVLYDLLDAWAAVKAEWGVSDSEYLFCTRTGNKVGERSFHRSLKRRGEAVGLQVNPHMLRHSYATERVHEHADVLELMSELGHRQVKTTMVYLHQENLRAVENMRKRKLA